jgi:hypothetical protein
MDVKVCAGKIRPADWYYILFKISTLDFLGIFVIGHAFSPRRAPGQAGKYQRPQPYNIMNGASIIYLSDKFLPSYFIGVFAWLVLT